MASEIKHMVTDVNFGEDGHTVTYGPGELHDPGSLPDGVRYKEVLATDAQRDTAPAHATEKKAEPEKPAEGKHATSAGAGAASSSVKAGPAKK